MRVPVRCKIHQATWIFAGLLAAVWIAVLAVQPVHIPVLEFSGNKIPSYTQALSGIKGQTMITPSDKLSRIDVWLRTNIDPGEYVRVKFMLERSVASRDEIASGVVVFNRSGSEWVARLLFDSDHFSSGDQLYLRLESILASPQSNLYYAYFGRDLYPNGELLELDRLEVPDQDLRFKLYRQPSLPKPLAWAEAAIAPAVAAAEKASGPPEWAVVLLMVVVSGLGGTFGVASSVLAARMLTVAYRREATAAIMLVLTAFVIAIMAGPEAPIGKLWVPLS